MKPIVEHYELNIASFGHHWAKVRLPDGLSRDEAKLRAEVIKEALAVETGLKLSFTLTEYYHRTGRTIDNF